MKSPAGRTDNEIIIVGRVIIPKPVMRALFFCDLEACRGGCCTKGGDGAPLLTDELPAWEESLPAILPLLPDPQAALLRRPIRRDITGTYSVPLLPDGLCACAIREPEGIRCAFESAWREKKSVFRKPVSCLLYPVRVSRGSPFDVLLEEIWNICDAGRREGRRKGVRLLSFAADGLRGEYGAAFVEELEQRLRESEDKDEL